MTHAVVISGGEAPFSDLWHPFPDTSDRLRQVLERVVDTVTVSFDPPGRLADLDDVDLLVLNVPEPTEPRDADVMSAAGAGFRRYWERRGPVLALHVSVTTVLGVPEWPSLTGARWVGGVTMHPPLGDCDVMTFPDRHPIVQGLGGFSLYDERYSHLGLSPDVVALLAHEHDDQIHPLLWARDLDGRRLVADTLGHDVRSYDSAVHVEVLSRAARWLLGDS
jgi:hypothetical protein